MEAEAVIAVAIWILVQVLLVLIMRRPEGSSILDSSGNGKASEGLDLLSRDSCLKFIADLERNLLLLLTVVEDCRHVLLTLVITLLVAGSRVMECEEESSQVLEGALSLVKPDVEDLDVLGAFQGSFEFFVLRIAWSVRVGTHEADSITK